MNVRHFLLFSLLLLACFMFDSAAHASAIIPPFPEDTEEAAFDGAEPGETITGAAVGSSTSLCPALDELLALNSVEAPRLPFLITEVSLHQTCLPISDIHRILDAYDWLIHQDPELLSAGRLANEQIIYDARRLLRTAEQKLLQLGSRTDLCEVDGPPQLTDERMELQRSILSHFAERMAEYTRLAGLTPLDSLEFVLPYVQAEAALRTISPVGFFDGLSLLHNRVQEVLHEHYLAWVSVPDGQPSIDFLLRAASEFYASIPAVSASAWGIDVTSASPIAAYGACTLVSHLAESLRREWSQAVTVQAYMSGTNDIPEVRLPVSFLEPMRYQGGRCAIMEKAINILARQLPASSGERVTLTSQLGVLLLAHDYQSMRKIPERMIEQGDTSFALGTARACLTTWENGLELFARLIAEFDIADTDSLWVDGLTEVGIRPYRAWHLLWLRLAEPSDHSVQSAAARNIIKTFLERSREFTILDPASPAPASPQPPVIAPPIEELFPPMTEESFQFLFRLFGAGTEESLTLAENYIAEALINPNRSVGETAYNLWGILEFLAADIASIRPEGFGAGQERKLRVYLSAVEALESYLPYWVPLTDESMLLKRQILGGVLDHFLRLDSIQDVIALPRGPRPSILQSFLDAASEFPALLERRQMLEQRMNFTPMESLDMGFPVLEPLTISTSSAS